MTVTGLQLDLVEQGFLSLHSRLSWCWCWLVLAGSSYFSSYEELSKLLASSSAFFLLLSSAFLRTVSLIDPVVDQLTGMVVPWLPVVGVAMS